MKWHKLIIIGIIAVVVVICFNINSSNNRYTTTKSGNDIYVTDAQSGETFLVRGTKKIKVVERLTAEGQTQITSKPDMSYEAYQIDTAISLAKNSYTLSELGLNNDFQIKSFLQKRTDNYEAIGWSAKIYSGSIAVVGYILKEPAAFGDVKYQGYYFEVDTKEDIVRSITKDGALHDKYKSTITALKNEITQTSR